APDHTSFSPLYVRYWKAARQGQPVGRLKSNRKLVLSVPAHTITKGDGYASAYHPTACRGITLQELKRIASFPDKFSFKSCASARLGVGNCVPPLFMRAIAKHIRSEILDKRMSDMGLTPVLANG
ncbi:hypothetical protein LCGC14_1115070, partial [marine sediment metagenome]